MEEKRNKGNLEKRFIFQQRLPWLSPLTWMLFTMDKTRTQAATRVSLSSEFAQKLWELALSFAVIKFAVLPTLHYELCSFHL